MSKKRALITGVAGQDGAYLAKFLIAKGYYVAGGVKNRSNKNLWRLKELGILNKIKIVHLNLLKDLDVTKEIQFGNYDEIYNLAAQSFVEQSFSNPINTTDVNTLGVIRILEAIRVFSKQTKFYQASSSEMFGNTKTKFQNEKTKFHPISPYAIAKLHSHLILNIYRSAYSMYCSSGILFNHESPLRGDEYVTKKIVRDLIKVKQNTLSCLVLGNIYSVRDWGYSADYVEAMWKMLQQNKADDFVISSGSTHTVKTFINKAAKYLGFELVWRGKGLKERAINKKNNKVVIRIEKRFFRKIDVKHTYGNSNKARKLLKWSPKTNFTNLIKLMCDEELRKYE